MSAWMPRSGFDKAGGYLWLPRLLDKVRQAEQGGDLGDYYVLQASPVDQAALAGWKVKPHQIREWVREGLDDEAIAQRIRETGNVSPEAFNRLWLVAWAAPMLINDADEGRVGGPGGPLLARLVPVLLTARKLLVAVGLTRST